MGEILEPNEPVDPSEAILSGLDFEYTESSERAAAFREGRTDPKILGFLNKIARGEIDVTIPASGRTKPKEPVSPRPLAELNLNEAIARRIARRLDEQRRLIQAEDDKNPDNWLS